MKLVDVEYNFDGNKILFFFTSECRVDFRALVKDLASVFHTRIELRPDRRAGRGQDAGWIRHLWKALLLLPVFG